ncbi:protein-disulfide reductase DsbD [Alkanindiges illinoisensis]|uniref:protein-disulfide reductase DsbD n=1 Tax=Alkanindiges illinoisensis TaxID=197183 RepID=UPI000AD45948|nr:protein-disulfide reductase DsbD [Alkanindiges illinoisensis]
MLLKLGFGGLGIRLLIGLGCTAVYSISGAETSANSFAETNNTAPVQSVFGQKNTGAAFNQSRTLLGQQGSKPAFLSATQAFQFSALQTADKVVIQANIVPGHYLYQQRFSVQGSAGLTVGKISFDQQPEFENDPEFGRVPVFHQDINLTVPVQGNGTLTLNWQGCAKAGVCYPPEQFQTRIINTKPVKEKENSSIAQTGKKQESKQNGNAQTDNIQTSNTQKTDAKAQTRVDNKTSVKITALGDAPPIVATPLPDVQPAKSPLFKNSPQKDSPQIAAALPSQPASVATGNSMVSDPFGLADHTLLALGLLFLAGLGLAFTPCVLPMLPIVANLVATQHRRSAGHGFLLAAGYAIGVACSYAMLGALIALFGHQINLIAWSQHPAILIGFAVVFALLALHSFEMFELRLPAFVRGRIEKVGQYGQSSKWSGSVLGCWVAGFFSALIVSPCLSAPLAGVLLSVSTVGNPWLGAVALFCLGLGLGVPLMILGATEGRFLPKAGNWLNWVRRGFGLLLFAVALILLNRVFISPWMLLLWAVLSLFFALWLWYWAGRGSLFTKVLAIVVGLWAVMQVIGAGLGATDPLRPLSPLLQKSSTPQSVKVIYTTAQLSQYQQQHPRLLVELTADWCIACKIVERELFLQNQVPELQGWTRVKLDVTQTNADSRAVLKTLNLFGPPAILLYQNGQLVEQVLGEPTRDDFQQVLQQYANE